MKIEKCIQLVLGTTALGAAWYLGMLGIAAYSNMVIVGALLLIVLGIDGILRSLTTDSQKMGE